MKLRVYQDKYPDELKPGEAIIVSNGELLQLIICCPQCGETSSSAGSHVFDPKTETYHPSVVHNADLGGCGAHYWIRNGEFIFC